MTGSRSGACDSEWELNEGKLLYHGRVQLHPIQLQRPCSVEETQLRLALLQPPGTPHKNKSDPNPPPRKQQTQARRNRWKLLVLRVQILHLRQEVFILLGDEVALGGVTRETGRAVVAHLGCRVIDRRAQHHKRGSAAAHYQRNNYSHAYY